ncbi:MAG: putative nucleic acid-binding Zn ribbon protein [Vicingaceae bacterium]|jgi:predicted nucleic acid-binding Zn ribbon protein
MYLCPVKGKNCPICNSQIKGRKDKIFCSPNCKSIQQYEVKREKEQLFFQVDAQLKANRKILKKYNKTGKTTLRRQVLHQEGFDPNYFTHFRKTAAGDVYFYCYDYGFLKIEEKTPQELKSKYLIINWNGK